MSVAGAPTFAAAAEALKLWPPDWIVLAVNLAVLLALIYPTQRLLLAPLIRILEEREIRTAGASAEAGSLQDAAFRTQDELESRMKSARAEAQARRNSIMAQAAAEERAALEAARSEGSRNLETVRSSIATELDEARRSLEAEAQMLAREAAAKILGRPL
jgi:F0F1-type ATP synthase membrane subunit b/b'